MADNNSFIKNEKTQKFDLEPIPNSINEKEIQETIPSSNKQVEYGDRENKRILRNVIILSLSFTLLFTSSSGMTRLQSSINSGGGLGIYSLSAMYGAIVISSIFVPTFVIYKFTIKTVIITSMLGYVTYIGAQFWPTFWTLIPTAVIVGICGAPLWAAKCNYITRIGNQYANISGDKIEVVLVKFFGIFFFTFQIQGIIGNLISSTILSSGHIDDDSYSRNISLCGSTFCPYHAQGGGIIRNTPKIQIYILAGIYLIVGLLAAMVVTFFLDSLTRYGEKKSELPINTLIRNTIMATFSQLKNPFQILIIPLTLWSGVEQGFYGSDFSQGYVTCAWGVHNLGYIGICYAMSDSISSILFGPIVKRLGRIPVFILGALLNISMIILLYKWKPNPNNPIIFFIIAGIWGFADGIWQTQINALYGTLFPKNGEAAFSNYRLWESMGFIIAYVNSNLLCMNYKLYILLGILILGILGYIIIEILIHGKKKNDVGK